jgi:Sec-independent protein translocase protein TatA
VGLSMKILFVLILGLVVLGPKRLRTLLVQVTRTKAQIGNATRGFKSQFMAEFVASRKTNTDSFT